MKKNDGYVIVVSLVIATAVLLLLGVFWGTIVAERRNIERSYRSAQALHLAEAGVEEAINNLPSTDSGEINIEGVGNCEYTSIISENLIIIQATGYSPEIAIPGHVKRKVEVTLEKKLFGVFDYAIFADGGGAELIENAYVDSYDSRLGSYASQATTYDSELGRFYANSSATVGTNSILPSAVSLSDFASVYGDAFVGPGGDPSSAISITDNAKITGYQGTMGSGVELPEVIPPASYDFVGGSLKVTSTMEINEPGVYRYDSISVSGKGVLKINASVEFYVESDVQVEVDVTGQGVIQIATGCTVSFYIGGNMKVAGNGIVNYNEDPTTLAIYGTDKCERIQFVGNADFYGLVYARKAEISVVGNGGVYGSLVGNKIYMSGNAHLHYDGALKESDEKFPEWAKHYKVTVWRER